VFLRIAKKLTDSLAEKGEWITIRQFCDAAIPIEPGDESLYRACIRSLVALGLEGEAKLVYRQREDRRSPGTLATRRRRA